MPTPRRRWPARPRRLGWALRAALAGGVLGGCVESALNPADAVVLVGAAAKEDGSPLSGAEVGLDRSINSACGGPERFRTLRSDPGGAFALELTGADTRHGDIARCFRLSLPAGPGGARVSTDFLMQVVDVRVPSLQQWTGSLAVFPTKTGWELQFRELSSTHAVAPSGHSLTIQAEAGTAWRQPLGKSPLPLTEPMLEDFPGLSAQLSTNSEVKGSATSFHFSYHSDLLALPVGTRVPASRGANCSVASGKCPLTDGRLSPVDLGSATEVRVILDGPRVLRTAVVRGLGLGTPAAEAVVEGSLDGARWLLLADLRTEGSVLSYRAMELSPAGPVKEIRLRGKQPDGEPVRFAALDELSLFE